MLHGIHCTPSCCIKSTAFNRVPFLHTAGNTMHSIGMHFNTACITLLHNGLNYCNHAAYNPLHSIGMIWAMLQKIHCNQSGCIGPRCMDSTAYNRDPLRRNACNPLHSITLHGIHCIQSGCILPRCIYYTALNCNA